MLLHLPMCHGYDAFFSKLALFSSFNLCITKLNISSFFVLGHQFSGHFQVALQVSSSISTIFFLKMSRSNSAPSHVDYPSDNSPNLSESLEQKNAELVEANNALQTEKEILEYSVAEVEMRDQMELMVEVKAGKHVDWNPDAIMPLSLIIRLQALRMKIGRAHV